MSVKKTANSAYSSYYSYCLLDVLILSNLLLSYHVNKVSEVLNQALNHPVILTTVKLVIYIKDVSFAKLC